MRDIEDLFREIVREEVEQTQSRERVRLLEGVREILAAPARQRAGRANGDRFLTVDEAAEYARHSPDTIRAWVHEGRLSRCGTSRKILVRQDELRNLLASSPNDSSNVIDMQAKVRELLGEE